MINCLPHPPAKKMRTDGHVAVPTTPGQVIDPTLKRKNWNSVKMPMASQSLVESNQFKAQNYRGALTEYFQKQGDSSLYSLTFDTKLRSGQPHSAIFLCTCKAGGVTATGEARVKKVARQLASLAALKKLGLVPEGYDPTKKVAHEKNEPQKLAMKTQPQEVVIKTQPQEVVKKTQDELIEERELDKEDNTYFGTVKFYHADKEYGFINIFEEINFKGLTAKDKIYVHKVDIVCWSEHVGLAEYTKVVFKVYKDSRGLGAYDVRKEDGTPILFHPKSEEDAQSGVSQEPAPETIVIPRKKKEMKPILENKQYVTGNFRGALQEYLVKKHPGVAVKFETELLQPISKTVVYVANCKAVGEVPGRFKGLVGTGHAAVKKSAIHFSALDFMMKLNLLTEAQHFQVHQHWSCY